MNAVRTDTPQTTRRIHQTEVLAVFLVAQFSMASAGAKDKLGLRVHGLIVGSPELKKADPAVLRSLCSAILPNGRTEVLVTNFEGWGSVKARDDMQFDWDDAMGNARRRAASLAQEALRKGESARRRKDAKAAGKPPPPRAKKDGKPEARKAIKLKSY